jgi:putative transposase
VPRLAPTALKLTTQEREKLGQILNRHSTPQQIALRAKIVLLADEGRNHHEIGRELEISLKMARLWRKRWIEGQEKEILVAERLCDGQRSGTPAKFELEQIFCRGDKSPIMLIG